MKIISWGTSHKTVGWKQLTHLTPPLSNSTLVAQQNLLWHFINIQIPRPIVDRMDQSSKEWGPGICVCSDLYRHWKRQPGMDKTEPSDGQESQESHQQSEPL